MTEPFPKICNFTKCLKNQPCNVIKMREMRGEVGKKPLKKRWIIPNFMTSHGWFFRHFVKLPKIYKNLLCLYKNINYVCYLIWFTSLYLALKGRPILGQPSQKQAWLDISGPPTCSTVRWVTISCMLANALLHGFLYFFQGFF